MTVRSAFSVLGAVAVATLAVVVPATTAGGDLLSSASELTTSTTVAVAADDSSVLTSADETVTSVETSIETVEETAVELADETLEPIVDLQEDEAPAPAPTQPTEDESSNTSTPDGSTDNAETARQKTSDHRTNSSGGQAGRPTDMESTPSQVAGAASQVSAPRVLAVARAVADKANASGTGRREAPLPLEESDFATGATRPSVTPLLDGFYRSSAIILDLLGGQRLTPKVVASIIAPFPVAGPARYRDIPGATSVTISSAAGVPVIASADGEIAGDAQELFLVGPDDTVYVYGGLDRLSTRAAEGGRVSKGDVIGFVDGDGFEFSLHPSGGPAVDPVPYLDRWIAEALQRAQSLAASPAAVQALTQVQRSASRASAAESGSAAVAPEPPRLMSLDGAQRIVATTGLPLVGAFALLLSAWGRKRWWRRLFTAPTT